MRTTFILYLSFFIVVLNACKSSDSELCEYIDHELSEVKQRTEQLRTKIESWNENLHSRMDFIRQHYGRFEEPLAEIENAIFNKDTAWFYKSKVKIDEEFYYLKIMIRSYNWKNIDFYWLLEEIRIKFQDLELRFDETCQNMALRELYVVEEDLLSALYMIGYTGEHVFSKVEPIARLDKTRIKQGDSIRINYHILAYDSTRVYEMTYWVNDSTFNPETGIYTNKFNNYIKGKKGQNTVYGIAKMYQYGKVFEKRWYANFEVE